MHEDIYEDCGPLSGLHAALSARPHGVFITAADMPFADPYLALHILKLGRSWDACIINTSCPHPLFGWYSSAVLSVAEQRLRDGQYSMTDLLKSVNTRYLSERELPQFNIGKCLLNINTPDEFIKLKNIHD